MNLLQKTVTAAVLLAIFSDVVAATAVFLELEFENANNKLLSNSSCFQ